MSTNYKIKVQIVLFKSVLIVIKDSTEDKRKVLQGQGVKVQTRTCLSRGHTSFPLFYKEILCPLLCHSLCLLRLQTNPFKTQWLIIYPGNEMPKPRETHHQERKGHSHPGHRYTLCNTHTHTQQWWMAITSLSALQADRVFILVSKHRWDQGQSKTWLMRWNLQVSPKEALI